ncbi:hypothetical protein MUK42_03631 [Musa troglodytarum]|uniref:Uncharacterized protein n=1 Tax=Musa troglodytarum TaxID=320322 RepID=A0A9E7GT61_9LILI|nr:hypothetical protein MUK42_03631 [Musa troglodytarum]
MIETLCHVDKSGFTEGRGACVAVFSGIRTHLSAKDWVRRCCLAEEDGGLQASICMSYPGLDLRRLPPGTTDGMVFHPPDESPWIGASSLTC